MTSYTRAEFATQLQKHASLVGLTETPSAAAQQQAEAIVEAGIGTLMAKGVTLWGCTDNAITHEWLLPLIEWHAPVLLRIHGQINYADSLQMQAAAEIGVRALAMTGPTGAPQTAEHF